MNQHLDLMPILQAGLGMLGLELPQATQEKIIKYIMLLNKWSQSYNLTSIRDPKSILIRHVFDSLAIVPFIVGPSVLDFGSGAGLPGIPLALALPKFNFVLLDSSNKKTIFLNHAILTLNIGNVKVVTNRAESFHFVSGFATIVSRATTTLEAIVNKTKHLCAKNGSFLIMKGKRPTKELEVITKTAQTHHIKVPYLDEERYLIKISN